MAAASLPSGCPFRDGCGGCRETGGRPFGRECPLAACGPCGGTCRLKSQLAAEFNALSIRDMPEVTDLNPLPGSFINLPYTLPNGQMVKLLEDDKIYLGNQLESLSGSPRCYGLAADEACLLVCAYGQGGSDPGQTGCPRPQRICR
mgnify:CR=1 FL=1